MKKLLTLIVIIIGSLGFGSAPVGSETYLTFYRDYDIVSMFGKGMEHKDPNTFYFGFKLLNGLPHYIVSEIRENKTYRIYFPREITTIYQNNKKSFVRMKVRSKHAVADEHCFARTLGETTRSIQSVGCEACFDTSANSYIQFEIHIPDNNFMVMFDVTQGFIDGVK